MFTPCTNCNVSFKQGYFGALGAFLLNQGIEHDGGVHREKDAISKHRKRHHPKGKLHQRSKSLGTLSLFST